MPPTVTNLYITDCQIQELRFEGWLPEKITVWCGSRIDKITASDEQEEAATELHYRFLDDSIRTLTAPASKHISRIAVHNCELETLRLVGFYPRLETVDLGELDQLKYLSAPYTGHAPKLTFPENMSWLAELPSLRLLKTPGTKFKSAASPDNSENWPPNSLKEVDLRETPIDNACLDGLGDNPFVADFAYRRMRESDRRSRSGVSAEAARREN